MPILGTIASSMQSGVTPGTRGLYGPTTSDSLKVEYITIATTGNGTNFGNLTVARRNAQAAGSNTRIVFGAGALSGTWYNTLDYFTSATTGNATSFGTLITTATSRAAGGNQTRGIWSGGFNGASGNVFYNAIEYITIATTGNGTNFGNLTVARSQVGGAGSSTRLVFFGGEGPGAFDTIDYVTIATTGNATTFGTLPSARSDLYSAMSSSTRTVHQAGYTNVTTMGYVTTATTGNSTNFGDYVNTRYACWGVSNSTRGVIGPGTGSGINYITIATTGNATNYGNQANFDAIATAGGSDCHGGIN